jgi:hypothetical protein
MQEGDEIKIRSRSKIKRGTQKSEKHPSLVQKKNLAAGSAFCMFKFVGIEMAGFNSDKTKASISWKRKQTSD